MRRVVLLSTSCLALWLAAVPAARAALDYPAPLRAMQEQSLDDPRALVQQVEQALMKPSVEPEREFWQRLGLAGSNIMMEQTQAAMRQIAAARALLPRLPGDGRRYAAWLEAYAIGAAFRTQDIATLVPRNAALRRTATDLGDAALLCEVAAGDMFMLRNSNALDEAWLAGEETERCGRALGMPHLENPALIALGAMAASLSGKAPTSSYFDRALAALGKRPARFQRGWVEWERGAAAVRQGDHATAERAFETSLALSREIGDATGAALVLIDLARLRIRQSDPTRALALAREALAGVDVDETPPRVAAAQALVIEAMTVLKRPELQAELERARRLDALPLPMQERVALMQRVADGHAALGQHALAYAALRGAVRAMSDGQQGVRDAQMLRLQARYETARRDAEVADLRHRAEAARLALEAREAQQRATWAVFAVMAGVLGFTAWRLRERFVRRRHLAELAMRDELTGMPNRRAVLAFGDEQLQLCRRLGLRLSVALVDLDHFKLVNDRHGHATGDRVLVAFARAAQGVLRGQDRIGRFGGDEWLLVMPGAGVDELAPAFERLRTRLAEEAVEGLPTPHRLTLSMGGAELAPGLDTLEALIAEADRQLYLAKDGGRNALRHPAPAPAPGGHALAASAA